MGPLQATTFHKHRKFTRARHMWLSLNPDWRLLSSHMYTDWPGIHSYEEINDRLFVNPGSNDNIQDTSSKVKYYSPEYWPWVQQQEYILMLDYHNENLACEDHGTPWQPDDALHETVYQTQLLTTAFYDGHYRTPALVNNFQRGAVVHLAIKNLKDMYPWMTKDSMDQIFTWLFYKHGPWLREQGCQLSFIERRLNTRLPVTATAVTQGHEPQ